MNLPRFHLPPCETDRAAPLTAYERVAGGVALLWLIIGSAVVGALLGGK